MALKLYSDLVVKPPLVLTPQKWTPFQLSGLTAWYDGQFVESLFQDSALTTPAGVGDVVGGWVDKSGNGYTMAQATTANKPTMTASAINGFAAPVCDGGDYLTNGPLGALFSGSDKPWSMGIVIKVSSVAAQRTYLSLGSTGSDISRHQVYIYNITPNYGIYRRDDAAASDNKYAGTPDTSPHVITIVFTGVAISINVDGSSIISSAAHNVGTCTLDSLSLGARVGQTVSEYFLGGIGELVFCNRALSSHEQALLDHYIGNRWGISL